jgi:hypothetical protein
VLVALSVSGGVSLMHLKYADWRHRGESLRATLAGVEIAGAAARPDFRVSFPPSVKVTARGYLSALGTGASPAFSEGELAARPEAERVAADLTAAQVLGLRLVPDRRTTRGVDCRALHAHARGTTDTRLAAAEYTVGDDGPASVEILLRRFASRPSVTLGALPGGGRDALRIPSDNSSRRWRLDLRGSGPVEVCVVPGSRPTDP